MSITAIVSVSITVAGFVGGIIVTVANLSVKYGKLTQKVAQNEERDKEEREHSSAKFSELYNRTAAHDSVIAALSNNVGSLSATCTRIESKLDRLIERKSDGGDK